jgi:hypothetical protein
VVQEMLALMYSMICHNVARNKVPHVLGIAIHPVATKKGSLNIATEASGRDDKHLISLHVRWDANLLSCTIVSRIRRLVILAEEVCEIPAGLKRFQP